ncbi:hypothetical protein BH23PLA1_BH23PLA1_36270 [soil metagenome]
MDQMTTQERRQIDRLVDGELSGPERRGLLQRIAAEPDAEGWRRCALAFLEAQCWREALGPIARSEPKTAEPAELRDLPGRRKAAVRSTSLLAAAAVLLAFAGGWLAGGLSAERPEGKQLAEGPYPAANIETGQERPAPAIVQASRQNDTRPEVRAVGYVQLPAENGQDADFRLPVLAGPGLDDAWLRRQPPALPASVRERWEDQGYRVEQRRKVVSVEMEDGRYLSIPVDEVDLHYVGPTTF